MAGPKKPVIELFSQQQQFAHASNWKTLSIREAKRPFNNQAQGWCKFSSASLTGPGVAVNRDHIVVPVGPSGSSLMAFKWKSINDADPECLRLTGSKGAATDLQFNNFATSLLASGSQNGLISLWNVDPESDEQNNAVISTISSHVGTRINQIVWNPLVSNCLASSGTNGAVFLHDIEVKTCKRNVKLDASPTSVSWAYTGDVLAYVMKKTWGLIDIRSQDVTTLCTDSHAGAKPVHICMTGGLSSGNYAVTSGFDKETRRELKIWDTRKGEKELETLTIDRNVGSLMLHYDYSTNLIFTIAKGDSRGQVFDLSANQLWRLNGPVGGSFPFPGSIRYFGFQPRRLLDTSTGEQQRLVSIVEVDNQTELRYSQFFKETRKTLHGGVDLPFDASDYPPCLGGTPLYTFNEWIDLKGPSDESKCTKTMSPDVQDNCANTPPDIALALQNIGHTTISETPELKQNIEKRIEVNNREVERIEKLVKHKNTKIKKQTKKGLHVENELIEQIQFLKEAVDQLKKENAFLQERYKELLNHFGNSPINSSQQASFQSNVSKSDFSHLEEKMKEKDRLLVSQIEEINLLKNQMRSITNRVNEILQDAPVKSSNNRNNDEYDSPIRKHSSSKSKSLTGRDLDDEERLRILDSIIKTASKTLKKQYEKHYEK